MALRILKGAIVSAPALGKLDCLEDGYLVAEDGVIQGVYETLPAQYAEAEIEDWTGDLILQSFSDMHLHAPQYPMLGMGLDMPLMDWLVAYPFPLEAKYADTDFARSVYSKLARDLVERGTTRVCIFSSLHRPATLVLMEELEKAGITGYAGKVNMDRSMVDYLSETTEESKAETLRWLEESKRFTNIRPMITPRFTPSCTDELMCFLGDLVKKYDLPVQSHLSENDAEIETVLTLCPDCDAYWESYAKRGLWTDRTLMAHCVWSDELERKAMKEAGVTVVHCGDSNWDLCSGTAPIREMLDEGVKVCLGSDCAGGDNIDMFHAVVAAIRASKVRHLADVKRRPFLTIPEAWYLAVSAPNAFFGEAPGFAPGNRLNAMVLRDDEELSPYPLNAEKRLERAVYRRQKDCIRAVYSGERKIYSAE